MADVQQHEQQVGFLRSTAQRAGQLALAAPRYAIRNSLPLTVQQRLNAWSTYLVGGGHETANEATSSALTNGVTTGSASTGATSRGGGGGTASASQNAGNLYLPSPVTYLTSAYLFTSLALAFLLHRIHHLVPPRQSFTHANAHAHARGGTGLHRVMQPAVQIGCRLPGIVLLVKAVALLAIALALARGHSLEWLAAVTPGSGGGGGGDISTGWITLLVQSAARATLRAVDWSSAWSGGRSNFLALLEPAAPTATTAVKATIAHSSLLWQVYLAICMTVSCESFVRALSDDLPHAQHQFNLLSFSFLLHIHAGPNPPAHNPAKYAELYTYLTVTMLEILALQVSYIAPHVPGLNRLDAKYRAWVVSPPVNVNAGPAAVHRALAARVYRLPVTTVFSLAAQYFALRSWSRVIIWPHASPATTTTTLGQDAALTMAAAEARLNDVEDFGTVWLNKIPEVTLEVIVGTSVALKALAALIRGEELSMENLIGPSGLSPQPEEDYAVALIKYATHLLSTTRLSGLAHELSPLEVLPNSVATSLETLGFLEPPPCESDECPVHGPENRAAAREAREIAENGGGQEVVLQRNGDVVFWDLVALDGHGNDLPGQEGGLRRRVVSGLTNEIRRVSVESPYGAETDENGYAADGSWTGQPSSDGGVGGFFPFSRRMGHVEGERKSALWRLIGVCARIVMFLTWRTYRLVRHVTRKVLAVTIGWKRDEWEMEQRWVAFERMRQRGQDATAPSAAAAGPIRPDRIIRDLTPGMTLVDVNNGDVYVVPGEDDEEDDAEWLPEREYGDEADDSEGDEDAASDDDGAGPSSPSLDGDELQNPLVLYSDLSRPQPVRSESGSLANDGRHDSAPSPEDLAPYLLAHHLSSSSTGPLTRRRYRGLVPAGSAPPDGVSALSTAIEHRRGEVLQTAQAQANGGDVAQWMEDEREKWREGRSRFCVVCTVEERTVVLWPCRCLCLCEGCRAALAERTTAAVFDDGSNAGGASGNQLCPTCRSPVQGFSRIFTP